MNIRLLPLILLLSLLIIPDSVRAAKEQEPNNTFEKATPFQTDTVMQGQLDDEEDYYRLILPTAGRVNITLTGFPEGADIRLGVDGFGLEDRKWTSPEETNATTTSIGFIARERSGFIIVLTQFAEKVCEEQWCIGKFTPEGTYFTLQQAPGAPMTYKQNPVLGQAGYVLSANVRQLTTAAPRTMPSGMASFETEPNDSMEQGSVLDPTLPMKGFLDDNKDYFQVALDQTGKYAAELTGFPPGTQVQLGVIGFAKSQELRSMQEAGGGTARVVFNARQPRGLLVVQVQYQDLVCEQEWCIARLSIGGPYYAIRAPEEAPSTYNGSAVLEKPEYTLVLEKQ